MDNITIENLSVDAVKGSVLMSEYLSPYLKVNDKESSFDGHIYIYNKKGRKNDDMMGRVAVQIKGKKNNDLSKNEISYSVKVVDLNNFLNDGGVIFFVVYITDLMEKKIYYNSLLPIKLRRLIQEASEQKTKSIRLKNFPTDNDKKRELFVNFFNDSQRQASFSKAKLPTIEDLISNDELINLKVYDTNIGGNEHDLAYIDNDVYVYAETKGSYIPQPLDILPDEIKKTVRRKASIKINGTEWYSEYALVKNKNEHYYLIGQSLRVYFEENKELKKIIYKNSNLLRVEVKDLDFFLSFLEYGEFYINNLKISFKSERYNFKKFNVKMQKIRLDYLKKVVLVLDHLGYKEDLDFNKLSERDRQNLKVLVTALIEKKLVYCQMSDPPQMISLCVAGAIFCLYLSSDEEEAGAYKLFDFFDIDDPSYYIDENGEEIPTSQYIFLSSKDLSEITNLRTDNLLSSFKKYSLDKDAWSMATIFLLKLIHAFDLSNGEKVELLDVAFQFAEWASEKACADDEKLISRLNYLHVIKRNRSFSPDEFNEMWDMVDDVNLDTKIKVIVYLLLGEQLMAKHYFKKLDKDQQEELSYNPVINVDDLMY